MDEGLKAKQDEEENKRKLERNRLVMAGIKQDDRDDNEAKYEQRKQNMDEVIKPKV